ncbi:MAG: ATP:cob(I)alamin adenosyltransferase [Elusimicrobiales bacterium]|nr:ATP:cob(I)alamin adenosyltransferase [Elusimicrobiales bacterium]
MSYKANIGKGDDGLTNIYNKRVPKSSNIIMLNALIDEVNSLISLIITKKKSFKFLKKITRLNSSVMSFNVGYLSVKIIKDAINVLEKFIEVNKDFDIKKFEYFEKDEISALLNVVRTKIRIAEIYAWKSLKKDTAIYLNRLSDVFFILSFKSEKCIKIFTSHLEQ